MKAFIASPLHTIQHPVYGQMYHNHNPRWDIIGFVFVGVILIIGFILWDFFWDVHNQNKRIKDRKNEKQD